MLDARCASGAAAWRELRLFAELGGSGSTIVLATQYTSFAALDARCSGAAGFETEEGFGP